MFTVKRGTEEIPINSIQSAHRTFMINDIPEMTITAVAYNNDIAFNLLSGDSVVVVDNYEWRVQLETGRAPVKNLKLLHIAADLIDTEPLNRKLTGTYTPRALLTEILSGTGFTLQLDDAGLTSKFVSEFGKKNRWKLLKEACELFEAEFTFGPNRMVIIKKRLSTDKGQQIRYGHNLRNISVIRDVSDIVTHVVVNYGENYANSATFTSPTANNYDRPHYGDIIEDERIESYADARAKAMKYFKDLELAYELDVANGIDKYELGETVHTIYEPLNDLSVVTRIQKIREDWNGEEFITTDVTVGNYVFKPPEQIMREETERNRVEAEEKLDEKAEVINRNMTLKFQETDQKIVDQYTTITTEYSSAISFSARELRTDFNQKITTVNNNMVTMEETLSSSITQTASAIRTEVNQHVLTINDNITTINRNVSSVTQTANEISARVESQQLTIDDHGTRMTRAESDITQTARDITMRVTYEDYTGETITSMINQTAEYITLSANKINFQGHVFGAGSTWSGNITTTQSVSVGNGLYLDGDMTHITSYQGYVNFNVYNDLTIQANKTTFYGDVDFSYARSVSGLNTGGLTAMPSSSGGKDYLTFRQNGEFLGMVELA